MTPTESEEALLVPMKRKYVISLLVFRAILLLGFIAIKQYTFYTGTEVILKTVPVDPRDLFRGDYVILNYEISRIDPDSIDTPEEFFEPGDRIYIKLNSQDQKVRPIALSTEMFQEGLFIRGRVRYFSQNILNIEYGIESYFVPQGKGKELERKIGEIDVLVALDRSGTALIKDLLIE